MDTIFVAVPVAPAATRVLAITCSIVVRVGSAGTRQMRHALRGLPRRGAARFSTIAGGVAECQLPHRAVVSLE
jgi:hypothetical protein